MTTQIAINCRPLPQAIPYEIYHNASAKWYRAFKLHDETWVPQPHRYGYDWGYKYFGSIQGYTRCRRCSMKRWFSLNPAPNIYAKESEQANPPPSSGR